MSYEEMLQGKRRNTNHDAKEFWNQRSLGFNKTAKMKQIDDDSFLARVIMQNNVIDKHSTVLDVGCGVGRHLIYFADRVKHVVGVDVSDEMLRFAKENLEDEGFDNYELYVMDWHKEESPLGENQNFDLVYASMSPALNSIEAIKRFSSYSKEFAMVERFLKQDDSFKDLLSELLGKNFKNKAHNNPDYTRALYNVLFDMGYFPEVFVNESKIQKELTFDEVKENYHRIFNDLNDEELAVVENYFTKHHEQVSIQQNVIKAIILWDVNLKH